MNYLKKLIEQRNKAAKDMEDLLKKAQTEERAMTDEETSEFNRLEKEINGYDKTIASEKKSRQLLNNSEERAEGNETDEAAEYRAFEDYIRGTFSEERADVNMTTGDNGAIIPSSIANKIIETVLDICPIYQLATRYNVKGKLSIPYYDESTQEITMDYADEFTELSSTSGKFKSISLTGFLAGALTKVSKSLINNNQFDVVSFVIRKMAEAVSKWIEKQLLKGTPSKIDGLTGVTQVVTAAAVDKVTTDELIDLQEEVPDAYQSGAIWIMNRKTRKAIRKLKDNDGNYLLNKDVNSKWGYVLLGKDVYTSDNMDVMAAGKTAIYYGDMSGLAVKVAEESSIEVLREAFATQHVVGIVTWMEVDSKVENAQKIAALKMKLS